jgi:hypothetical protein
MPKDDANSNIIFPSPPENTGHTINGPDLMFDANAQRSTLKMNNIQIKTTSQSSISVPIATTTASSTENGALASNIKSGPFIVCPVLKYFASG